ncbi:T9SS type A sorting domain-containing protein [Neolewinella litorea]|nr:T9SS type A sorting domain-containing protein [Neolewinella litorea]
MKRLLPFFLICLLPVVLSGQKTADPTLGPVLKLDQPLRSPAKAVVDTIIPDILLDTCARRVAAFGITDVDGFVTGSNGYGDIAKLQRLEYNSDEPYAITAVGVAFAGFDSTIANTFLRAFVFDDLQADSSFGAFLGESDSLRVSDILLPTTRLEFTYFTFPEPVIVENDSFLVGIDFGGTYDTAEEGYVGIYHTRQDCGDGRNVFEFFPTQTGGLAFGTLFDNWGGLNIEMIVTAVIDTDINTSTRARLTDYATSISPNPTSRQAVLTFNTTDQGSYTATLTDLTGRQVRESRVQRNGTTARVEWQVSDLPAGLYLYHVDGPSGRQSGKLMVQ